MACKIACGPSKLTLGGPADFEATVILLFVSLAKKENLGPYKIVRALENITLRAQMNLGNFCLF